MEAVSSAVQVHYVFDPATSRFTVQAFATGPLSMFAHSPTFAVHRYTGEVMLVPDTLESASVKVVVDASSLAVLDELRESDRREIEHRAKEEVLEVAKFPQITFESTKVSGQPVGETRYSVSVTGRLTLHGVTNEITIPAQVSIAEPMLRASGTFPIVQTRFGIRLVTAMGGAIRVKDELKCSFDIVARRHDTEPPHLRP